MWWYEILGIVLGCIAGIFLILCGIFVGIGIYFKLKCVRYKSNVNLSGKTVLVTGGTAGMGFEIAKEFARRDARVIIACPFQEEGILAEKEIVASTGNKNVIFKELNLASLQSVREFADGILKSEDRLNILVNNAGVLRPDILTADGLNFIMQVNYFGHFLLTILLLPLLKKTGTPSEPSRIITVCSSSHVVATVDIKNLNRGESIKTYANSKLCVAMYTRELAKRLKDSCVVVHTTDPGFVMTNIIDGYGEFVFFLKKICVYIYPNAQDGAQTAIHASLDEDAGKVSGEYYVGSKVGTAGQNVFNEEVSHNLWEESIKLVKLSKEELNSCFD